ncbi:MAG: hypothetical protein LBH80_02800 [Prevotellaceae bacterium]|nr:hypothetical protein [Prevotellaceae bacterium]
MSFKEIASHPIPCYFELRTIRNIVYRYKARLTPHQRRKLGLDTKNAEAIYKAFRLKFLELKSVSEAIHFVFKNQPVRHLSTRTIRRIVGGRLLSKHQSPNTFI